jgi:hypothetical protein
LFAGDPEHQSFVRQYYALQGEYLDLRYRANVNRVNPAPGKLTVYPCLQDGYSESTARSADLQPGLLERHALILPAGSRNGPIRLDPAESVCIVELQRVSVCRAADSMMLAEWAGPALAQLRVAGDLAAIAAGSTARYFSTGHDPQLYLPPLSGELGDQPLLLEIWIRTIYDLRALGGPLVPIAPGAMEMDFALKESRERAAEMEVQRNDAVSRNRTLEAELAEVRSHQAEQLTLIADHRRNQTLLEVRSHELEVRLREKEELDHTERVRLEQRIQTEHRRQQELREQYEHERNNRTALLQSLSWRVTGPFRRLYEVLSWMRRPKP